MRFYFLLALVAAFAAGCDSDVTPISDDRVVPAPIVSQLVVTDVQGSEIGMVQDSALVMALAEIGGMEALVADSLALPDLSFLMGAGGGAGGTEPSPGAELYVLPNPTPSLFSLRMTLPDADEVALYFIPAVASEGAVPPSVRAITSAETIEGYIGVTLYSGPTEFGTYQIRFSPQRIGMDYGLYRFVLIADGERVVRDLLYAPCLDGEIAGVVSC